jgi:hypothetical protein
MTWAGISLCTTLFVTLALLSVVIINYQPNYIDQTTDPRVVVRISETEIWRPTPLTVYLLTMDGGAFVCFVLECRHKRDSGKTIHNLGMLDVPVETHFMIPEEYRRYATVTSPHMTDYVNSRCTATFRASRIGRIPVVIGSYVDYRNIGWQNITHYIDIYPVGKLY